MNAPRQTALPLLLLGSLLLALSGCFTEEDAFIDEDNGEGINDDGMAEIRLIHAAGDGQALDLHLDGEEAARNLGFADASEAISLEPGDYELELFLSGSTDQPLLDSEISVSEDGRYSLIVFGSQERNELELKSFEEPADGAMQGEAELLFMNAAHEAGSDRPISVELDNQPAIGELDYGAWSNAISVGAPGDYSVVVRDEAANETLLSDSFSPLSGQTHLLIVAGIRNDGSEETGPRLLVLDAL